MKARALLAAGVMLFGSVGVVAACTGDDPEPPDQNITINNFGEGGATSSSSGTGSSSGDGGSSGGTSSSSSGGPSFEKAEVACGPGVCPVASSSICCSATDGGGAQACTTAAACPVESTFIRCDSRDDCGSGQRCCATPFIPQYWDSATAWNAECRNEGDYCVRWLCRSNADCPDGGACTPAGGGDFFPFGYGVCPP